MHRLLIAAVVVFVAINSKSDAAVVSFRSPMVPNFELTLFPALDPTLPGPVTLPGTGAGYLDFVFDFDSATPTLDFISVSGFFRGSLANGLGFDLFATGLDTGTATNVTESGGVLTGADLEFSLFFEMFADNGVKLVPDTSLPFTGSITSLPFLVGDIFAGPTTPPTDPVPGKAFVDTPNGTVVIDDAVSVQNRTLTVVPEPSSLAVWAFGTFAVAFVARRRCRKQTAC